MHSLGQTRSANRRDHLLLTPDTFIRTPLPGLTGGSAPDLFGRSFTASRLTMGGLHQEVTNEMPLDAPASLTPTQYAAVIAYLLAANCYAPGTTPYPVDGHVPNRTDKVATQNGAATPCAVP